MRAMVIFSLVVWKVRYKLRLQNALSLLSFLAALKEIKESIKKRGKTHNYFSGA